MKQYALFLALTMLTISSALISMENTTENNNYLSGLPEELLLNIIDKAIEPGFSSYNLTDDELKLLNGILFKIWQINEYSLQGVSLNHLIIHPALKTVIGVINIVDAMRKYATEMYEAINTSLSSLSLTNKNFKELIDKSTSTKIILQRITEKLNDARKFGKIDILFTALLLNKIPKIHQWILDNAASYSETLNSPRSIVELTPLAFAEITNSDDLIELFKANGAQPRSNDLHSVISRIQEIMNENQ
jgi:hypothetical protein